MNGKDTNFTWDECNDKRIRKRFSIPLQLESKCILVKNTIQRTSIIQICCLYNHILIRYIVSTSISYVLSRYYFLIYLKNVLFILNKSLV